MEDLLRQNIQRTIGKLVKDEEFELFSSYLFTRTFDKKSFLAEEGEHCKYVYFILKGSAYSYFVNEHGEKHAMQFALEGYWITDHFSFFSGKPGIYSIETLEPSKILVLNRENFENICNSNHHFEHFFRILIQNAFISQQYRLAKTNSEDAEHRYHEFSKLHPDFIQRIPQYLIASYLGIKPQSLSRIRNEKGHSK
ncbi:cAMP-binding domain of CRP or a regulatory subunit of cAMP-dependent protein kinases [Daejeonella rubra]|uniref:cAMP-binding domain of CRP or a regulatory subunit of cAMP-dependent protein kinases n=1 Tax=Daejeonella rubra TaxID=990371 RepID=A0A1G9R5Z7_9SPHI|nr:Crp/Fnr family transcriptional regulator [Daejeonella rubra]SDM18643.1 cAMP-binding domain of CRP or a regulatory subunit of cAMP-dependent protein kinases [Daejeonella rubra]